MAVSQRKGWLFWAPRILCILAIAFISLFALDTLDTGAPFGEQLLDFLIHMIPSFLLIIVLLIAWKREVVGGVLFICIGLIFTPWIFNHNYAMNQSIGMSLIIVATITLPFVLAGILFLLSHYKQRRNP